ncbi:NAD(P)H-binding protein [Sphingobium chlorophenolicum]|uniref:NAD(P)H-binding protein n=1 Tax=Sphingobium chlorophenolicum TaxID=46429 RepID=UPI00192E719C|nr:NAD(P)H-binding protein [Sphingobium chlorophenolicum]
MSGASGKLGQAIVAQLAAMGAGEDVVAISRTPDAVAFGLGQDIERRAGDYDDPALLASAYAGLDRLVIIPSAEMRPGIRSRQFLAAIDAALAAGVGHIVLVSAMGTRKQEEPHIIAPYWIGEQHLMRNAPAWTIVRMNYYAESFADDARMAADAGVLVGLRDNRVAYLSRDDLAAAVAGVLLGEGHEGAIYSATGPKSFDGAERAALAARFTGRPIDFMVVPEDQLRASLTQAGIPEELANAIISIQSDYAAGNYDIVTGDVERLSGRPPRSLESLLASMGRIEAGEAR